MREKCSLEPGSKFESRRGYKVKDDNGSKGFRAFNEWIRVTLLVAKVVQEMKKIVNKKVREDKQGMNDEMVI